MRIKYSNVKGTRHFGAHFNRKAYFAILPWMRNSFVSGHYVVWAPENLHYMTTTLARTVGLEAFRLPFQVKLGALNPYVFKQKNEALVLGDAVVFGDRTNVTLAPERLLRGRALFSRQSLEYERPAETSEEELVLVVPRANASPKVTNRE